MRLARPRLHWGNEVLKMVGLLIVGGAAGAMIVPLFLLAWLGSKWEPTWAPETGE